MRLCDLDVYQLRYGDVLLLRDGVHACNKSFYLRRGVIVRGESKAGTVIRGTSSGSSFGGLSGSSGRIGVTAIENLTIESAFYSAISVSGSARRLAVTDVDVQGISASGIRVDQGATATVTRYRYRQSQGTAIVIGLGHVDASFVEVTGGGGVWMLQGTLRLASSSITGGAVAVQAGTLNDHYGTRDVTISNTTLRANTNGFAAVAARVTITGSTIEALTSSDYTYGIDVDGGELSMSGSTVQLPDRQGGALGLGRDGGRGARLARSGRARGVPVRPVLQLGLVLQQRRARQPAPRPSLARGGGPHGGVAERLVRGGRLRHRRVAGRQPARDDVGRARAPGHSPRDRRRPRRARDDAERRRVHRRRRGAGHRAGRLLHPGGEPDPLLSRGCTKVG
jgi:hypothetical protein